MVDGPTTLLDIFNTSPVIAGTDDTLPSLSITETTTGWYTPVPRGPLEGEKGQNDLLTGVSNDLPTTLQYFTPVAVSVRDTKHPVASEPGLKRHTSPVGEEVLAEIPITPNVPGTIKQQTLLWNVISCCTMSDYSLMATEELVFP